MRMWMVDPRHLCCQHLLGEHSEIHKHRHVFVRHYSVAGRRGQIEPVSMAVRHNALAAEMLRRGYKHESPYSQPSIAHLPPEDRGGKVDVQKSLDDLCRRCSECRTRIQTNH